MQVSGKRKDHRWEKYSVRLALGPLRHQKPGMGLFLHPFSVGMGPSVQDMYARLSSANLDFDSELHVFCWEPGECRDSRVFHFDRVFLRLC